MNSPTLALAMALIARPSLTPDDQGCQDLLASRLARLNFRIENLTFGQVSNLWACWGKTKPLFVFAGHTDVVPIGSESQWHSPPFTPTIKEGYLYGRGSADMKGSLAAMIVACEQLFQTHAKQIQGSIGFLITSDEEGPAVDGTVKVIETLKQRQQKIDYCLVGEPSSSKKLGDIIKNGRRGSLSAYLTIYGKQGHIAYPQFALNPIQIALPALQDLYQQVWDQGNPYFPATSFHISNITAGTGADNVIPGELNLKFNFRYSTATTHTKLQQKVEAILQQHQLSYKINWRHSGFPFLTEPAKLVNATQTAIKTITGNNAELSTTGGTSDGRFIAPTGAQVIELGPLNATIHQVNECVAIKDLERLSQIYYQILLKLLT